MTTHDRDKVIAAAKEAGFSIRCNNNLDGDEAYTPLLEHIPLTDMLDHLYAIAFEAGRRSVDIPVALAEAYLCGEEAGRQAEREECAVVCDTLAYEWRGANSRIVECAAAIRARGDMK